MDQFFSDLSRLLRPEQIQRSEQRLVAVESDALTAFAQRPLAVISPYSAEDLIEVVRLCGRHEIAYVARGSGTSLSGGSLPIAEGVVISLSRLRRIIEIDPDRRLAVVEPGVINQRVSDAAKPHGLYYAPDPSSQSVCTIGGNVAFNSGGAHCLTTGMTSNHVIGLKVVLPNGELAELGGGDSLEHVGPDLVGLFVGSEGLLGIAYEITLRLLPLPQSVYTLLAAYDSLEAAGDAVAAVVGSGLLPAAMEIMDELAIEAAEAAVGAGYPDKPALLIVELDGEAEVVLADSATLRAVIDETEPSEVRVAHSPEERDRIWRGRKGAFSAVGRLSPDYIVQDGVVPRLRLGEALKAIGDFAREDGLRVANVFHAGDGNLHPLILYDGRNPGELERAEELAGKILRLCLELGGSITGEHGVGVEKLQYMADMFEEPDLALMERLKLAVDPISVANPGKMLPDGAPALTASQPHPLEAAGVISRE